MNETMLDRVNTSLNTKFYSTNYTWLRDCVEYYMSEHDTVRLSFICLFYSTGISRLQMCLAKDSNQVSIISISETFLVVRCV